MKRKPIIIGDKIFKYQKDALLFYKNILNSYNVGESLNDEDWEHLWDLLQYSVSNDGIEEKDEVLEESVEENDKNNDLYMTDIRIAQAQYNNQCFK